MTYRYMHLIDGEPANYENNGQIVRIHKKPIRLVASLDQVKREQKASDQWRNDCGFSVDGARYGYAKVLID